jgi:hypothetical protein
VTGLFLVQAGLFTCWAMIRKCSSIAQDFLFTNPRIRLETQFWLETRILVLFIRDRNGFLIILALDISLPEYKGLMGLGSYRSQILCW